MEKTVLKEKLTGLELLIFDIDGVLVDVNSSYRLAIKKTVEFFSQQEIQAYEIQALKNESGYNNDWDLTQELLKRKDLFPERDSIINQFQSFYWGNNGDGLIQKENWLLKADLLQSISEQYHLSIFTGRPSLEANFVLSKNNASAFFKPVLAMEDVTNGKPHPEGLINICSRLSIHPKKACYFGDTFDDMRAACRADILPIGVLPPSGNQNQIPQYFSEGAYEVFEDVNELEHCL